MFTADTRIITASDGSSMTFGDAAFQWETTEDPIRVFMPSGMTLLSDCSKTGTSTKAYAISFEGGVTAITCSESHRWEFLRAGNDTSFVETSSFLRVGDVVPTLTGYVKVTEVKSLNADVPFDFYQLSIPMSDRFMITDGVNQIPVLSETL